MTDERFRIEVSTPGNRPWRTVATADSMRGLAEQRLRGFRNNPAMDVRVYRGNTVALERVNYWVTYRMGDTWAHAFPPVSGIEATLDRIAEHRPPISDDQVDEYRIHIGGYGGRLIATLPGDAGLQGPGAEQD